LKSRVIEYYAKILLFGEYSLMVGSNALTIPYTDFSARLRFLSDATDVDMARAPHSNRILSDYVRFLADPGTGDFSNSSIDAIVDDKHQFARYLDLDKLKRDVDLGLFLDSTIPNGYGLGSSGALVAALFSNYCQQQESKGTLSPPHEIKTLKIRLASMESFFHGTSSGIDPLSCYFGQPLLFDDNGDIIPVKPKEIPSDFTGGFFLIDTKIARNTGPLVTGFFKKNQDPQYSEFIKQTYNPVVNACIHAVLDGDMDNLSSLMQTLSKYQHAHFRDMIPPTCLPLWETGIETARYSLKLCGAGGGGFLLGFTQNYEETAKAIAPYSLIKL
jgi:mevalonate kinase